ncbi:hypothetical protein RN001_001035 [Aquatica leii]|uniref:Uncharacterized protein n=1 Tax=Aquatica leii TaxID=1421715 RepID=A0AAN7Q3M1_9COLE|nr:hypothetical protein RN001_001035 [Aquatica leii]
MYNTLLPKESLMPTRLQIVIILHKPMQYNTIKCKHDAALEISKSFKNLWFYNRSLLGSTVVATFIENEFKILRTIDTGSRIIENGLQGFIVAL